MCPEARLLVLNPSSLSAPRGYSHGILTAAGPLLFVAGQVGWDAGGQIVGDDFTSQFDRALGNVLEVVRAARGAPGDIVKLTIFVTDKQDYLGRLREIGQAYRRHMGKHFPAMSLVEVKGLVEPGAKVEIEAVAAVGPDREPSTGIAGT